MARTPRQSRSRFLAESVVEAAEELLTRSGAVSVSVASLARRAGVGVASIYDYFSDKAGVMDAVVDRLTIKNFEELASVIDEDPDASPFELVNRLSERVVEVYLDARRSRLMTRVAILAIRRSDPELHLEYLGRTTTRLAQRARETWTTVTQEEAEPVLRGICDLTMGTLLLQLLRGSYDEQHILALLRRAALAELGELQALHERRVLTVD